MTDGPVIDVERLVEDVRRRVADVRARGGYGDDVGYGPLPPPTAEEHVRFRPELGYSSKPLVGRPVTAVKQVLLKMVVHVMDDLARQIDHSLTDLDQRLRDATREGDRARRELASALGRIERLEARLAQMERQDEVAARPPSL